MIPAVAAYPATAEHVEAWASMRDALWPGGEAGEHRAEAEAILAGSDPEQLVLIAQEPGGQAIGFVEASIRHDYVNGCDTSPVAFLEGGYVQPAWRRRGVAQLLVAAVEAWGRSRGCTELASDADIANTGSHALHARLGFEETERVVFFRKPL